MSTWLSDFRIYLGSIGIFENHTPNLFPWPVKAEYVSFCEVAIGSVYYVKRQNKTNFPNTLLVEKPTHVLYSPPHRQEGHMGVSNAPIKLWRFANILWFAL